MSELSPSESSPSELVERVPTRTKAGAKSGQHPVASGAADIAPGAVAGTLRPSHQFILDAFIAYGAMTPDELAEKIARSVFYTRPRCSELRACHADACIRTTCLLRPTGEVHCNALSGLKAAVLTTTR